MRTAELHMVNCYNQLEESSKVFLLTTADCNIDWLLNIRMILYMYGVLLLKCILMPMHLLLSHTVSEVGFLRNGYDEFTAFWTPLF